jgi:hypothetical protein
MMAAIARFSLPVLFRGRAELPADSVCLAGVGKNRAYAYYSDSRVIPITRSLVRVMGLWPGMTLSRGYRLSG